MVYPSCLTSCWTTSDLRPSLSAKMKILLILAKSEICTKVSLTTPKVMWTLIMKLPHTEVKSQTGLSSFRVSCKRALKKQKWNFSRSAIYYTKTRASLEYIVNHCHWKLTLSLILSHPIPLQTEFLWQCCSL